MKDSGIEWIGEIPEEWKVVKLKKKADLKTGTTPSTKTQELFEGTLNWFTPADFYDGVVLTDSIRKLNENCIEDNIVPIYPPNSVLIVGIGATIGKVGFITKKASSNQQITAIMPKEDISGKYLLYMMVAGINFIRDTALYTTLPILNNQTLGEFMILDLPIINQKKIVDFIDNKCTKIDKTIKKEKEVIEKLKEYKQSVITEAVTKGLNPDAPMKDSGVEWIGEIPAHWQNRKLKSLLLEAMKYGANESGEEYDEHEPRYIRITDITLDSTLKDDGKLSLPFEIAKPYLLEEGDILFARSGATVGKSFIFKNEYGLSAFAGYLIKAKLDKSIAIPQFIFYYTLSNSYNEWKNRIFIQATIQNIGADKYSNMNIAIPPINEQKVIIDYLDKKCLAIDKLITNKEKVIEKLTEYKKSLIYECVTGKREV